MLLNNLRSILTLSFVALLSLSNIGLWSSAANAAENSTNNKQQIATLKVNINKATADEISDVLTGVGLKKAMVIVEYRNNVGSFKTIDDLLEVKGIGPATLAKNRHKIEL